MTTSRLIFLLDLENFGFLELIDEFIDYRALPFCWEDYQDKGH